MVQTAIAPTKPVGSVLTAAGLISSAQLEIILQDQQRQPNLRFGDILELRGWLKRDSIEFFAEQWPKLRNQHRDKPLGYYFQQAGLLNSEQVQSLLQEQSRTGMRIGALAVLRGWLQPKTLDLFIQHLAPEEQDSSPFMKRTPSQTSSRTPSKSNIHSLKTQSKRRNVQAASPKTQTTPVPQRLKQDSEVIEELIDPDCAEIPWIV
jgi:hypothetical protein